MIAVPKSVMPKGVEHITRKCQFTNSIHVPKSVMPKGVEHTAREGDGLSPPARAEVSDAERR